MKSNILTIETETNPLPTRTQSPPPPNPEIPNLIHLASQIANPSTTSQRQRVGKIARLPLVIRQRLNAMLDDGVPYEQILANLPELTNAGVTAHNISTWKRGGYQDWVRHQEQKDDARLTVEAALELLQDIKSPEALSAANEITLAIQVYRALGKLHQQDDLLSEENVTRLVKLGRVHASLNSQQINRERLQLQIETARHKQAKDNSGHLRTATDTFNNGELPSVPQNPLQNPEPTQPLPNPSAKSVPSVVVPIPSDSHNSHSALPPEALESIYDKMKEIFGIDPRDPAPVEILNHSRKTIHSTAGGVVPSPQGSGQG